MKLLICLLVLLSLLFFLILLLVLRRLYHLHLECLRLQMVLAQQDDYRTQALTDVLTGLPNRRSLRNLLSALSGSGRPVCAVTLDLNGLKEINDLQGHVAGDHLLRQMAQCLRHACPSNVHAFRVGGDEFVLIGADLSQDQSKRFVEHLRSQLSHAGLDAALGWTWGTADALENLHGLLTESDRQMYFQKRRIHRRFSWASRQSADQARSV
ncbi:GGDEF domain-containing protein [Pseudoflavonifractor hominis]|uniref:GGDEF domain-containing protein n=1 Tax=Pseudoflavonifractor hominis TaxID=2763059 RepID=A0ABR7HW27_9FIRM|nr:GGDEF domain-containing protein [Pseudoflavonifractor hominis]MBC5731636.1 GGDEF domain-containing protein [Pseudoflavonifractor hominis]